MSPKNEAMIPTARGDSVAASQLGYVLPTELIIQESPEMSLNWPDVTWNALPEEQRIAETVAMLNETHERGIGTIVDRTIPGIGRNVPRMQKIALQTKLNIIVTTGWYVRFELPYYFQYREHTPQDYPGDATFEDLMVRDIEKGILVRDAAKGIVNTGVRAGVIKVISDIFGIEQAPDVRKVFRSVSRAHRRTGAPIVTHTVGVASGLHQQRVFEEEGVDLTRVVLGHMDRTSADVELGEFERALDKGSFLSFDGWDATASQNLFDNSAGEHNVPRVAALIRKGYVKQILLSSGWPITFADTIPKDFRGARGKKPYTTLDEFVIPRLRALGVGEGDIRQITHSNPQRLLSTLAKGGY